MDGCADGHDAVRVGDRAFLADTRHGDVVEIAVPPAAEPYRAASLAAGAVPLEREGHANVIKRHAGFSRADHVNGVAVHPELLIANLHGREGTTEPKVAKRDRRGAAAAPTRLSALRRDRPSGEGRELALAEDGFKAVTGAGTWCHGIAFWEDEEGRTYLITLDSKEGALVSVALAGGPNPGRRAVLWSPAGRDVPILRPPPDIARAHGDDGVRPFSKGLAVRGGAAIFGVSYARAPPLRRTVPETLLVAVDLSAREELWARPVRSEGMLNHVLTRGALGDLRFPDTPTTAEPARRNDGGSDGTGEREEL